MKLMYTKGKEGILVGYAATQKIYLPCIRDEQIRRGASLGKGKHGQVWKGEIELGNTWVTVAVKQSSKHIWPMSEAKALLLANNVPRIPKLLGVQFEDNKDSILFMELIEGITFEEYTSLQRKLGQRFPLSQALKFFEQVKSDDQPPMKCSPND